MPLAGERYAQDDFRRVGQNSQREYEEWKRVWWDEVRQRERTPAEVEAIKRGQISPVGSMHHPPSDFEMFQESRRENERIEAAQREKARKAAQTAADERQRSEIAARQAAFLLEDQLERDLNERIGF